MNTERFWKGLSRDEKNTAIEIYQEYKTKEVCRDLTVSESMVLITLIDSFMKSTRYYDADLKYEFGQKLELQWKKNVLESLYYLKNIKFINSELSHTSQEGEIVNRLIKMFEKKIELTSVNKNKKVLQYEGT